MLSARRNAWSNALIARSDVSPRTPVALTMATPKAQQVARRTYCSAISGYSVLMATNRRRSSAPRAAGTIARAASGDTRAGSTRPAKVFF
jgi:hypothetical protein